MSGGDFDGGEKEFGWPDWEIAGGGGAIGESEEEEKRKEEEEESFDRSVMTLKGAGFTGALLCPKGASEGGALLSTVAQRSCHVRTPGRH
jgi:hypothetical protein